MKKLILAFLFLQILGCSNETSSKESATNNLTARPVENYPEKPIIKYNDNGDDTGDGDFAISIVAVTETDTSIIYKALSTWGIKNLGLLLAIPKKESDQGFGQSLLLKSIGPESDNFLRFMGEEYKQKPDPKSHFKDVSLSYVNMNTFAATLGAVKNDTTLSEYKLFFEGPGKDDYAELYLNINHRDKIIEFKENDQGYRPQLIKFLRK